MIPDQTGVTVRMDGPNTLQFNGFGLRPAVQLATVTGRPPDQAPRTVELSLASDGEQVWTGSTTIPAGAAAAQGPPLIVGAGSYSLTGTPPPGDAFGAGTLTGIDPAASSAPVLTLPYDAATLTVTAVAGGIPRAGATVTVTPDSGTGPAAQTTNSAGIAVFRDLPSGAYTVTAESTQGGVTVRGERSGEQVDAGRPRCWCRCCRRREPSVRSVALEMGVCCVPCAWCPAPVLAVGWPLP